jgi:hypothetical protein
MGENHYPTEITFLFLAVFLIMPWAGVTDRMAKEYFRGLYHLRSWNGVENGVPHGDAHTRCNIL